jgi:Cdc6-like AAA superfamily ATPase
VLAKEPLLQRRELLSSLTTPEEDLGRYLNQNGGPTEGTCEWVTDDKAYKSWSTSKGSQLEVLGIVGGLGTGKTMISAFLATHIQKELARRNEPLARFAHYFCAARVPKRTTALDILRGWLH